MSVGFRDLFMMIMLWVWSHFVFVYVSLLSVCAVVVCSNRTNSCAQSGVWHVFYLLGKRLQKKYCNTLYVLSRTKYIYIKMLTKTIKRWKNHLSRFHRTLDANSLKIHNTHRPIQKTTIFSDFNLFIFLCFFFHF